MGDIDPDAMAKHDPYASEHGKMPASHYIIDRCCHYTGCSQVKDILLFLLNNPLETHGYCNYLGIIV
jgi:hypothetical protein